MNRSKTAIFTLLITVSASSGTAQSADPVEELKACARMADRDARYACFDDLGERVLRAESAAKKPARKEEPDSDTGPIAEDSSARPLPDDFGQAKFGDDQESGKTKFSGRVTSCKQGHYGDWYFIFDNGQVWKNVGERRLRLKECNFDVTITEGLLGYVMIIEDLDRTISVRRHQ